MNKRQKIVQEAFLNNEEAVIRRLKSVYSQSLKDITAKTEELQNSINSLTMATMSGEMDEAAKKQLQSMIQSKIYQRDYQNALKKQVSSILDSMQVEEFKTVSEYLNKCYEDGFAGTMYDLHGQGIPLVIPLDQEAMVRAVQLDSKISNGLYTRLGEDVALLKRKITAQVSRGISTGMSFQQIAKQLSGYTNIGFNNAVRIARTEGHRIQVQSGNDALYKAKEKGADVVKQWDATLDKQTRRSHQHVDGEVRELDEPFSNGLMYPGDPSGGASEVVNCRCALLQRARWAIDDDELEQLKERAAYFGLDKTENFDEFKKKYLQLPGNADKMNTKKLDKPIESSDPIYESFFKSIEKRGIEYKPVVNHASQITQEEIISILSGGDNTAGSCASLGLAYIGQKQGWDILDFRGGDSQKFFSNGLNLLRLSESKGIKKMTAEGKSSVTVGNRLLKQCEVGKEYYLVAGRHASIVRKLEDGTLQYLELQSATRSGWTNFNGNARHTLATRFGCSQSISGFGSFMIDIDESDFSSDDFKSLLGFINTAEEAQKKGKYGSIK